MLPFPLDILISTGQKMLFCFCVRISVSLKDDGTLFNQYIDILFSQRLLNIKVDSLLAFYMLSMCMYIMYIMYIKF